MNIIDAVKTHVSEQFEELKSGKKKLKMDDISHVICNCPGLIRDAKSLKNKLEELDGITLNDLIEWQANSNAVLSRKPSTKL